MRSGPHLSLAIAAALLVLISGCALMMESPDRVGGGASLGDAAAAAKPDSGAKVRRLDVGYTIPPEREIGVAVETSSLDASESHGAGSGGGNGGSGGAGRLVIGLVGGGGTIGGSSYDGFGEFGALIGYQADRLRADLILSVGPIQFGSETLAGQSFRNEFDLNADISGRWYLTPGHTFVGVYPIAGFRFGTLFWDFAQPVNIVEDGRPRQIKSDRIDHFSIYGGLGTSLVQTRHVVLSSALLGGARLYGLNSNAGFSNTLFADVGFVQVRLSAEFR